MVMRASTSVQDASRKNNGTPALNGAPHPNGRSAVRYTRWSPLHLTRAARDADEAEGRTPRPVPPPVDFENTPAGLRGLTAWVMWRYTWSAKKKRKGWQEGDPVGAWDKPLCQRDGNPASSTDPATWCTFEEARAAYKRGGFDGVGLVLPPDEDYLGVDLDLCRDPATGEVSPWARRIIDELDSYAEISPSGTGVRVFTRGVIPGARRRAGKFEIYGGRTIGGKEGGRYLTVTGQHLGGTPKGAKRRQEAIDAVYRREVTEVVAAAQTKEAAQSGAPAEEELRHTTAPPRAARRLTDDEIIRKAKAAKNGAEFCALWGGNTAGYPSHSEADMALCGLLGFWTGPDPDRLARLFRRSRLFRPPPAKAADYPERTAKAALARKSDFYRPAKQRLRARGSTAPPGTAEDGAPSPRDDCGRTDAANGKRLVLRHGEDLRWCDPWEKWLVWDGTRWQPDAACRAEALAKEIGAGLWTELGQLLQSPDARQILSFVRTTNSAAGVRNMLQMARSEPGIPLLPAQIDRDPWVLNCLNGTLDLRTGELRAHDRGDLITKLCPVAYDPAAPCPTWEACLRRWMGGNDGLTRYLQRVVGYALTGDVGEQSLWLLYGSGANGKSTFLRVLLDLLGDYALQTVPELLMVKTSEAHPTERADLAGKRFVATVEVEQGKRLAESLTKQLTGGDKIRARRMREDFWEFDPTFKLFLAANHKPVVRGTDHAVWRRIKMVPFDVTIPPAERDPGLVGKLQAELPGVLAWAVRGCAAWLRDGLGEPDEVRRATEAYRQEQDLLGRFLADCCVTGEGKRVRAQGLFERYREWSGDRKATYQGWAAQLAERGFMHKVGKGNQRFWVGLELLTTAEEG